MVVKFIVLVLPFARILRRVLHTLKNDNHTSDDSDDRSNNNNHDNAIDEANIDTKQDVGR